MKQEAIGVVEQVGEEFTLVLERDYPVPIESVWRALIEPEKLQLWLGSIAVDGRVGGSFDIDFGPSDKFGGAISRYEPPHVLEFDWGEGGGPSVVRFDLEASGSGTRLRLTHSRQSAKMAAGTGPGWHAHLDVLGIILSGGEFDLEHDYHGLYKATTPSYAGTVPAEAP